MNQRHKVPKLLHTIKLQKNFLDNITISDKEDSQLRMLRKEVRSALKVGFKELRDRAHTYPDDTQRYIARLEPKFWTQGSFVYRTLNSPAYVPPQQIDLDDGVYFPMEVVEGNPKAAKDILFKLVDGILRNLANSKGWEFDDSKSTCARLNVNERIHIDVPIYAIPEERYAILKASLEARTFDEKFSANANFDAEEDIWLDSNLVYLAMRNKEHWKPSDPMVLQRWFEGRCSIHTKRLRRVCRYLKAWRDFTWKKGGPSSITLMVAATETFDRFFNLNGKGFDTDCQAFLAVVRAMPNQFDGEIYNPEDSEEKMFPRGQSSEELQIIRSQIRLLKQQTEDALCNSTTTEMVVDSLRSVFGMRIPNRPDWVEVVTVSESVRNIPAQRQERPQPSKSHRSA